MKISKLIKLLEKAKAEHGNIDVIMDISDTNTSRDWEAEDDPCLIGIRSEFELETIQYYSADTGKLLKPQKTVKLLPDFVS